MYKEWTFYTPAPGKKRCPIMRFNEWAIVMPGETLLAHKDHDKELRASGLVPCKGPRIFKTLGELEQANDYIGRHST